jgi:hypothetical protein
MNKSRKHLVIASVVVFVISLGVVIPALGLLFGWVFTFGGGLAGGCIIGYLRKRGGRDAAKYGVMVALLGGIPSSVVGVIVGTLFNVVLLSSQDGSSSSGSGLLVFAVIGFMSGIIFKIIGGFIGGGITGWFFDEEAHNPAG